MYDFHYNYSKKKYKDKAKLLFTDIDSLIYHIETEDVYGDIRSGSILAITRRTTHLESNTRKICEKGRSSAGSERERELWMVRVVS